MIDKTIDEGLGLGFGYVLVFRHIFDQSPTRVKLASGCFSEWSFVPAGVPQRTKLGPWLYILMTNDLNTVSNDLWKYTRTTRP